MSMKVIGILIDYVINRLTATDGELATQAKD